MTRPGSARSLPLLVATLAAILTLFGGLCGDTGQKLAAPDGALAVLELVRTAPNSHVSSPSIEPAFRPSAAIPGEAESAGGEADPSDEGAPSTLGPAVAACVSLSQASLWRRASGASACVKPERSRALPLGLRFSLATRPTRGPPA